MKAELNSWLCNFCSVLKNKRQCYVILQVLMCKGHTEDRLAEAPYVKSHQEKQNKTHRTGFRSTFKQTKTILVISSHPLDF